MAETDAALQQKCPACGAAVDLSSIEPLTRVACPNCGEKFRVERAFDHFEIVESLGLGGMGAVYKARDTRLERFVALKLLRKELSTEPAEAARLAHEARMTAAVNHPNVIQVYSSGSAHGQIYLVMELVDHGSLDDLMAQKTRVPEIDVLRAGIQVARGLQAAHAKGLIHRDVKPANILFADELTAKIGDFGLAGAAEPQAERPNEIWGTPYYVAPERLNNEPEDFRSDIFSLGATLFHAIAGKPPIEGETTSAAELRELKSHPPDLQAAAPGCSRETARTIHRMLAANPADRFSSYAELVEALVRAYGEVSGTARKSRTPLLATITAVLLLALGLVGYFFLKKPAPLVAKTEASKPTAAPAQIDNRAELERRFAEARKLIVEGKYDPAVTAFTRLAIDANGRQPLQNWARLHQGLTALLQGKTGPARDAFQQLQPMNGEGAKGEEEFFAEAKRVLTATGSIAPSAADNLKAKSVEAMAFLLYGLKNWQLNEFESAAGFFEKFLTSDPPNEWKWMADYKPIAQKHAEDFRRYAEWKKTPEDLAALSSLREKLQTRGALPAALSGMEKRLRTETAKREKETSERQADERKRAFANDHPRFLAEWKKRLIADLQTGAFKTSLTVNGAPYQGIVSADDAQIKLRAGQYGEVPTGWDKLPAPTLLEISKSFIKPGAPDAPEREWLAAVYAESKGLKDEAKSLADSAAKAKAEYAPLRDLLFEPQS